MIQPISILLCALGGEGGSVLADWLIAVARRAKHPAQATSIPGVAQRTGATTYYLEIFPQPLPELGGKRPVLGLNPLPGRLDALVSSELLETARQIGLGLASPSHTLVISSLSRALTVHEKSQIGDGRLEPTALLQRVAAHSRAHHVLDTARMTRQAGTVVSSVMLGSIAASGLLPFARADFEAVIGGSSPVAQANLRGFALAYDAVQLQRQQAVYVEQVLQTPTDTPAVTDAGGAPVPLPQAVAELFAPALHHIISLGHARVTDYQDADYANMYVGRLERVLMAEQAADPNGHNGLALTQEVARWLALWMAYDDMVRVADLKSRASRWERVRGEVKAGPDDLLMVYDHFKPGLPELATLLPEGPAQALLRWERKRVQQGKTPLALALKVGSHSVLGMAALRGLAWLKWLRPFGSRFITEQTLIEEWLERTVESAHRNWALGHEIACCGRLIKGYGSTNERGKENLLHILQHLSSPRSGQSAAEQALAIAAVREAALKDEAGKALDLALTQQGAPARPVKAQPIRWMKNPREGAVR